ncbi:MAG: hypothetical protein EBR02_08135 [Alphaproteobacteria bacterium]|nr:hypothetical protein [Alphaproteobacteria bacterium]
MIKFGRIVLASLLCCVAVSATAQVQVGSELPNLSAPSILPALPATEGGSMVLPPMAQPGRVPALPPSRICAQADIIGKWKLLQVYEEPTGPETGVFYSLPSQYLAFNVDSTYDTYEKDKDIQIELEKLKAEMKQQVRGLQQYVMQANGHLYFYRDSVATKQQACFIVVTGNTFFAEGQMLLMPPNPQSPTRWVKVYSKIWVPDASPSAALTPTQQPAKKSKRQR